MTRGFLKFGNEEVSETFKGAEYDTNCDLVYDTVISNPKLKKFLVLGKVQSGKTKNMIDVSRRLLLNSSNDGYKYVIMLTGTKNILNSQNYLRFENNFVNTGIPVINFSKKLPNKLSSENSGTNGAVYIALKNVNKLQKLIEHVREFDNNPRILIIDDEADHASLNNNNNKMDKEASKTYSEINKLVDSGNCVYIGYTATPQGLLLGGNENRLLPERIVVLEPGGGYYGVDESLDLSLNSFEIVNDSDSITSAEGDLVSSLQEAVRYFVETIGNLSDSELNTKYNMVIHNSPLKKAHENLSIVTKNFLKSIDPNLKINVVVLNQSNLNKDNLFENPQTSNHNIIIGGELLSRGYTIPNLLVFYSSKISKTNNLDTLYQRMRFCGYREQYKSFIKIYVTSKMYDYYKEVQYNTNYIFDSVKSNSAISKKEKNIWFIAKTTGLVPTRKGVMSRFVYEKKYKCSNVMLNYYKDNQDPKIKKNRERILSFMNRYSDLISTAYENSEGDKYKVLRISSVEDIDRLIDDLSLTPNNVDVIKNFMKAFKHSQETSGSDTNILLAIHDNVVLGGNYVPKKAGTINTRKIAQNRITFIGTSEIKVIDNFVDDNLDDLVIFIKDSNIISDDKQNISKSALLFDFHLLREMELFCYEIP